jgi:hypothetical protein
MPRTTVNDAIVLVLKASAKPMSAREIYDSIVAGKLYEFNSKDPFGIVRNQISRHCVENTKLKSPTQKLFRTIGKDLFIPLE